MWSCNCLVIYWGSSLRTCGATLQKPSCVPQIVQGKKIVPYCMLPPRENILMVLGTKTNHWYVLFIDYLWAILCNFCVPFLHLLKKTHKLIIIETYFESCYFNFKLIFEKSDQSVQPASWIYSIKKISQFATVSLISIVPQFDLNQRFFFYFLHIYLFCLLFNFFIYHPLSSIVWNHDQKVSQVQYPVRFLKVLFIPWYWNIYP
jgi:hypothetical protein